MLAEGKGTGVDLPLVAATLTCFEEAERSGLGARLRPSRARRAGGRNG